jgi:hypothetical protein
MDRRTFVKQAGVAMLATGADARWRFVDVDTGVSPEMLTDKDMEWKSGYMIGPQYYAKRHRIPMTPMMRMRHTLGNWLEAMRDRREPLAT